MEQKKRGKKVLLTVVTIVLLAVVVCGGYELWMYEHPEIQIGFNRQQSEGIDRLYPTCSIRSRSHIGEGYDKRFNEQLRQYWEATNEFVVWIAEDFDKPMYVTSDVKIGDGRTVISYRGNGVLRETGENVEINREYVLDFEMDAKVIPPEEDAELTEAGQY